MINSYWDYRDRVWSVGEIDYFISSSICKLMNPSLLHKVGILKIGQSNIAGIGLRSGIRVKVGVRLTKTVLSADLTSTN